MPMSTAKGKQEPEMDVLSAILSDFNDMFGNIDWNDADNVRRQILEIPAMVVGMNSIKTLCATAISRKPGQKATACCRRSSSPSWRTIWSCSKQYTDNQDFKKWLSDLVFNLTYNKNGKPYQPQK